MGRSALLNLLSAVKGPPVLALTMWWESTTRLQVSFSSVCIGIRPDRPVR